MFRLKNINMNNKNRKIALIILVVLLAALLIVVFFLKGPNNNGGSFFGTSKTEFLSDKQKEFYGLSKDTKAQAFYDEDGNLIYKIIKDDSDVVKNPVEEGLRADWK